MKSVMKCHALLACPPMVMALLKGAKTQTRRIVAPHNSLLDGRGIGATGDARRVWDSLVWATAVARGHWPRGRLLPPGVRAWFVVRDVCGKEHVVIPRVAAGDMLWFKERHCIQVVNDHRLVTSRRVFYPANFAYASFTDGGGAMMDRFSTCRTLTKDVWDGWTKAFKWSPSIHMPRWACRLVREVVRVDATTVQAIGCADAAAEGLTRLSKDDGRIWKFGIPDRDGWPGTVDWGWPWQEWLTDPREAFRRLWDSINDQRGYGWDDNPAIWAYTFKEWHK